MLIVLTNMKQMTWCMVCHSISYDAKDNDTVLQKLYWNMKNFEASNYTKIGIDILEATAHPHFFAVIYIINTTCSIE